MTKMNGSMLTWLDVERVFKKNTSNGTKLPKFISGVRCYADSAEVDFLDDEQQALDWLSKIFGDAFEPQLRSVRLALGNVFYPLALQVAENLFSSSVKYPLWSDVVYIDQDDVIPDLPSRWDSGPALVAFHSFKGGVGRTTALVTYIAAALDAAGDGPVRLLVIDADFEAPGISLWLDELNRPSVSFAQFIEAVHYPPVDVEGVLDYFASELRKTSLDAGSSRRELFVLPSALSLDSMMDMPVKPEHIARNAKDPWKLSEYVRALGAKLGVSHVFIDLRAGLSELSSSLLFDPRVEHFFVTTVAPQSVKGMAATLERLYAVQSKLPKPSEAKPTVILSMLTPQLRQLPVFGEAEEALARAYPGTTDDVMSSGIDWVECDFASSLMSLASVRDAIDVSRQVSSLYREAALWAENSGVRQVKPKDKIGATKIEKTEAENLHRLCERVQFAEQIATDEMLATEPLRNLGKHFSGELPNAISVGAKGAGKTFTFLQVCRARNWSNFLKKLEVAHGIKGSAEIFPVLWSANLGAAAIDALNACRDQVLKASELVSRVNGRVEVEKRINASLRSNEQDWASFWDELVCDQLGVPGKSLEQLNEWLKVQDRQIVLVFDGIEDAFEELQSNQARDAVKGLLQLPNRLAELRERHIGAIVFARADYVQAAIRQNVAQFLARFTPFNLEWTPESFLRLSYWLCGQAGIIDADPKKAEELTVAELMESLVKLWGKKLGKAESKEARSALWVFGVLCDLKGRFQARDLVRFLRFAAELQKSRKFLGWPDRVLAPESMRQAIPKCSEEKVAEAAKEIAVLGDWKERLDAYSPSEKHVPFDPASLGLGSEALSALKDLGVIYEDIDQKNTAERFYLPEIYRQGLKFETTAGGRPRTLALLKKNLPRLPF